MFRFDPKSAWVTNSVALALLAGSLEVRADVSLVPPEQDADTGVELIQPAADEPSEAATPVSPTQAPIETPGLDQAMLVLDASGSMWGEIGGETKIAIARNVIGEVLGGWDENTQLGLMAYGHRQKGDCTDIEVLLEPQTVVAQRFATSVGELNPKGKTPLTQAVINAAEVLKYTENRATVILVSDGEETCGIDPCEAGRRLESLGVDFTAHVVSFDVPEADAQGLRCLAETTGGQFLHASNASELQTALIDAAVVTAPEQPGDSLGRSKTENKQVLESTNLEVVEAKASIQPPAEPVVAGSKFPVLWQGPKNRFDQVAVFSADGSELLERSYLHSKGVSSPVSVDAPETPGDYLLRYYTHGKDILAEAPLRVTPASASVAVPDEVMAGAPFPVTWTGPESLYDQIVVVSSDGEHELEGRPTHRRDVTSPTKLEAPRLPGNYLVRYRTRGKNVLAETPLQVAAAKATLSAPQRVQPEQKFEVSWTGPNNKSDRIQIVDRRTGKAVITRTVARKYPPLVLKAPPVTGDFLLRYYAFGTTELASSPLVVAPYEAPAVDN